MVLPALRACSPSEAKNVAAIMFNRTHQVLNKGNQPLHVHHPLNGHRAVHQPDAGVGGVAVDAGVGEGGVFVAAGLHDSVVHLIEETNYRQLF